MPIWDLICSLFTYLCVLYTLVSLISKITARIIKTKKGVISPIIKPENYKDDDILLRKSLAAVNWKLIANKANALYLLKQLREKKKVRKPIVNSASFTFGQSDFHCR